MRLIILPVSDGECHETEAHGLASPVEAHLREGLTDCQMTFAADEALKFTVDFKFGSIDEARQHRVLCQPLYHPKVQPPLCPHLTFPA